MKNKRAELLRETIDNLLTEMAAALPDEETARDMYVLSGALALVATIRDGRERLAEASKRCHEVLAEDSQLFAEERRDCVAHEDANTLAE